MKRQPNKVVRKSSRLTKEIAALIRKNRAISPLRTGDFVRVSPKTLVRLAAFCESKGYGFSILSEGK